MPVGHPPAFFLSGSSRFLGEHGRQRASEPGVRAAPGETGESAFFLSRNVCLPPLLRGARPLPVCAEDSEAWIDFS